MTEAEFQSKFTHWAKEHATESAAYELKVCKTKRLPFSRIAPHQFTYLLRAKASRVVHKISDIGFGVKPFDCFSLVGAAAYIVILFYVPQEKQEFFMVDIDLIISMRNAGKKSITRDECMAIGKRYDF